MADDESVLNSLSKIVLLRVFNDAFDEIRLSQTEFVEADSSAVLCVRIGFIFPAIEDNSPNASNTEGVICFSVMYRNVGGHIFRVDSSGIVITSGKDCRAISLCDTGSDLADCVEIFNVSAVIGNVAVKHEQIKLISPKASRRNRLVNEIMRVGNVV